jgi:FKBP-type peptidyl-prolyl cis-trans isomerase
MKKILIPVIALAVILASCQGNNTATGASPSPSASAAPSKADASYAFGVAIGTSIASTAVAVDYDAFLNGVKDVMEKKTPKVTTEQANTTIQAAIADAQKKLGETNAAKEKEFLATNGKKDGIKTTASGLQYQVVKEGTGKKPVATDTVKVDYVGKLLDGTTFDSSVERKQPAVFQVGGVIPGWAEAVQLMSVGSKYKVWIPSSLAYGEQGAGGKIGPNACLEFEIDLLSIEAPEAN